ncbi:MAG: choice-of-anchor D domain-containing protein [Betaproteobacteria bacterium]|nr:choice-of-anchor D domain-containing protein [Betaproteobacteria bacterium]
MTGMVPAYPGFYTQQTTREITFGNQGIGTSRTISVNLLNVGTATATVNFSGVSAPMSLGGTCGTTIPAGGSCQLDVTYAPTGAGTTNQTLSINHTSPSPIQNPSYPFLALWDRREYGERRQSCPVLWRDDKPRRWRKGLRLPLARTVWSPWTGWRYSPTARSLPLCGRARRWRMALLSPVWPA